MRYWTAHCQYQGKSKFLFWSPRMHVIADSELVAEGRLRKIAEEEWATISPHPAPPIIAIFPGRLVQNDELLAAMADEKRSYG